MFPVFDVDFLPIPGFPNCVFAPLEEEWGGLYPSHDLEAYEASGPAPYLNMPPIGARDLSSSVPSSPSEDPGSCGTPPSSPVFSGGELALSPHKKNQTKKGDGKDAKADEFDKYEYAKGWSYKVFEQELGHAPKSQLVFAVCKTIRGAYRAASYQNRWAKRRFANAFAWLDRNQELIELDLLKRAIHQ
jgi:hypothetical protein